MIGLGVIVVIAVIAIFALSMTGSSTAESPSIDSGNNANVDSNENVKTFVIDSSHLRFYIDGVENPDIVVNEGDRVRIEFSSSEGFHDWAIDEFNAKTERVSPGSTSTVEFIADKKGSFKYYCSVGQHRANGMEGNFIVE